MVAQIKVKFGTDRHAADHEEIFAQAPLPSNRHTATELSMIV